MKKETVVSIIFVIFITFTGVGIYSLSQKNVTDRVDSDSKTNDNNSVENKDNEKDKDSFSYEELSNMALEYFYKNNSDLLSKNEYSVGVSEDVIPKYENQDMVVIEIRHINGSINTLDARYFINIYTAKGFDMDESEIDLND